MVPTQVTAKVTRRRISAGVAVALAATTLAACGSSSSNSGSGSGSQAGSSASSGSGSLKGQTINYWASVEGTGPSQTTKTLTAEFKQFTKQTGVKVDMQVIPWSDLLQKILTSVTSGTGPDVMEIGNTWAPSLSASNGFLPFDSSNMNAIGGASKFASSSLKVSGLPGKAPVSVPVYSEAYALFYNKADFKAAGISSPPKTWAQLVADGKKLTTGGRYGIAIEGGSTSEAAHWAFLMGEQAGNPLYANGKWDFATAKEAKAISTYVNMVGSEKIANPSDAQSDSNVSESDFANNKAAMLIWQNPMSTLSQLGMKPSEYGSAAIPSFSAGASGTAALQTFPAGINLAVPASTKHKAAALALVKFLTSKSAQVSINHTYGTFPPVLAAQKSSTFSTPDYKTLEAEYNNHAAPLPQVASESTMETDLGGAITKLIASAATGSSPSASQIESGLSSAQTQLNASSGGFVGTRAPERMMSVLKPSRPAQAAEEKVSSSAAPRRRAPWWQRESVIPYLLIAPAVLFELLVHFIPMVAGVVMSLYGLTLFTLHHWSTAPFVGLANYKLALSIHGPIGKALLDSFEITVPFTVLSVGLSWLIGIVAATGLNVEFRGRGILRSALLVPYALPVYVAIIVWSFMLQRDNGVVNTVLVHDLHIAHNPPFWLLGNKAFWSMVAAAVWRWFPFAFLILLAALQNIPTELYEAAAVDGASSWRQFRSITLPSLRSANLVLILVLFLWNFNDFNTPFVLFGDAPPSPADLVSLHIYVVSFESWNFGLGSAMSVMLMLFLMVISVIYLRVLRRGGEFDV